MNAITITRSISAGAGVAVVAALGVLMSAATPRFFDDDPIWVERDTQDASGVKRLEIDLTVDLAYNVIAGFREPDRVRAMNLNSVDEVPDSSWFTNRAGRRDLTPEDVANGPNRTDGPTAGPWTITSSKSDGVTPGFTIKDATGQRWFLKFDPPGRRGMATGTEVAVTKLMWTLGYNVPENHIAYVRRDRLVTAASAKFTPAGGRARPMRSSDLDALLARANREPDGSYRVVASRALDGEPVGRVRFFDTRPDDPNDIVPHQHRRELRGYGVFAAWLNHVDAKAINSLDTLVVEGGRAFVKHSLIDFGSALGSGGVGPAEPWAGAEYLIQPGSIARQMIGFGVVSPRWHTAAFYESPSIGRLPREHAAFDPREWKPRVPNQAFLHARADDQFWAARKLMALTTGMLRAAVRTGDFGDPASEDFLVQALAGRRDAIGRVYLTGINPIVDPALDVNGVLTFGNAAVDADFAHAPREYFAVWSTFDNATGDARVIGESGGPTTRLVAPAPLKHVEGSFLKIQVGSRGAVHASWAAPVDAFFRYRQGAWSLVGFERLPQQ